MEKKVLIELFIDEGDHDNALDMISFVSAPAIEKNFMHFKENKESFKFKTTDLEKRIVTGPAMVPNQEIIRLDGEGNPYFVFFTEDTIEKAQEVFHKYGKTKSTNFEHEVGLRDVTVIESWLIEDPTNDKSNALGFSDLPKGSWMVSYKVDNDELWQLVKQGEVLGFSIEGVFSKNIVKMSQELDVDATYDEIKTILSNDELSEDEMFDKLSEIADKLK